MTWDEVGDLGRNLIRYLCRRVYIRYWTYESVFVCTCTHVVCTWVCVRICVYVYVCVSYPHVRVHTRNICTWVRTRMCMYTYMCVICVHVHVWYVCTWTCTYVYVCPCSTLPRLCACVSVRGCVYTCTRHSRFPESVTRVFSEDT